MRRINTDFSKNENFKIKILKEYNFWKSVNMFIQYIYNFLEIVWNDIIILDIRYILDYIIGTFITIQKIFRFPLRIIALLFLMFCADIVKVFILFVIFRFSLSLGMLIVLLYLPIVCLKEIWIYSRTYEEKKYYTKSWLNYYTQKLFLHQTSQNEQNESTTNIFINLPCELCNIIDEYKFFDIAIEFWRRVQIMQKDQMRINIINNVPNIDGMYFHFYINLFVKEYSITDVLEFMKKIKERTELYDSKFFYVFNLYSNISSHYNNSNIIYQTRDNEIGACSYYYEI
jgi:hypothetical protein